MEAPGRLISVLILCTGNSCRSQMAEGFLKKYGQGRFEVESAGTRPSAVNPIAVRVMREAGVDLSARRSKHLDEFKNRRFDYVVTVCDNAKESCPAYFGSAQKIHLPFPDPPHYQPPTDAVIGKFREVRDLIDARFKAFAANPAFGPTH